MSRGLSELQKTMLTMALKNRVRECLPPLEYDEAAPDRALPFNGWPTVRIWGGVENWDTLKSLVPEAFTKEFPDGYWYGELLTVGRFNTIGAADDFAATLKGRGLKASWIVICPWADVYFEEIMISVFRCPLAQTPREPPPGYPDAITDRDGRWLIGHRLDRATMGVKQYASAAASTSRAFDRLEGRGLALPLGRWREQRFFTGGIKLTSSGIAAANELTANNKNVTPSVNHYLEGAA